MGGRNRDGNALVWYVSPITCQNQLPMYAWLLHARNAKLLNWHSGSDGQSMVHPWQQSKPYVHIPLKIKITFKQIIIKLALPWSPQIPWICFTWYIIELWWRGVPCCPCLRWQFGEYLNSWAGSLEFKPQTPYPPPMDTKVKPFSLHPVGWE